MKTANIKSPTWEQIVPKAGREKTPIPPLRTSRNNLSAFTLIEILVVIVIAGTLLGLGIEILNALRSSDNYASSGLLLEKLFADGRESAIRTGKIYSLEINFENKKFGLKHYREGQVRGLDKDMAFEFIKRDQLALIEPELEEKSKAADIAEQWIMEPVALPAGLESVLSVSGAPLPGTVIDILFYPNGSSDSVIFYFPGKAKPYLLLPHQNISPRYLTTLNQDDKIPQ